MRHLVIIFLLCFLPLAGCHHTEEDDTRLVALEKKCFHAMRAQDWGVLDSLAPQLLKEARNNKAEGYQYQGKAYYYMAWAEANMPDSLLELKKEYLEKAEEIATRLGDRQLLTLVYNQLGVLELVTMRYFATAQYWFIRSMETARSYARDPEAMDKMRRY